MKENLFNEKFYCSEAGIEGGCTFDPTLSAIREALTYYSKGLAFYLLKFKDTEFDDPSVKIKLIDVLSSVVVNADFSGKEFEKVIIVMRNKLLEYEKKYKELFEDEPPKFIELEGKPKISDIIKCGEISIIKNNLEFDKSIRNLYSIILHLTRSAAVHTKELHNYKEDVSEYITPILEMLNSLNFKEKTKEQLLKLIKDFSQIHYKLINELENEFQNAYGDFIETSVSKDELAGHSILVSGHNFFELEKILDAVKGTDINVYTHDGLINAHLYKKFRENENLVGHYQKYLYSSPADFASFKGAIFITGTPMDEFDSFIRGRIFTTSLFSGLGITKIYDNDFSPLINTAISMKGFCCHKKNPPVEIGHLRKNIDEIIADIKEKFEKKEIKQIFIIKMDKNLLKKDEDLNKLINSISDDTFVFSTHKIHRDNYLQIDAFYDYSILYYFLDKLKNITNTPEMPITLFVSHCNIHTISYLITLSFMGIKIYLGNCSYFMVNPSIMDSLDEIFKIKKLSQLLSLSEENIKKEL